MISTSKYNNRGANVKDKLTIKFSGMDQDKDGFHSPRELILFNTEEMNFKMMYQG